MVEYKGFYDRRVSTMILLLGYLFINHKSYYSGVSGTGSSFFLGSSFLGSLFFTEEIGFSPSQHYDSLLSTCELTEDDKTSVLISSAIMSCAIMLI